MMTRQSVVLALVLLAGCANQTSPKLTRSSRQPTKPVDQPAQSPDDEPKWRAAAPPSASELLAQKSKEYATALQPGDSSAATDDAGRSLREQMRNHETHQLPRGPITPSEGLDVPPAAGSVPKSLVHRPAAPMPGDPQIVPESADFQVSSIRSNDKDPLADRLRRRMVQNPRDIANQLDWQMYGILNDDPNAELASVSAMPDDDRELVSTLVDGLSNFRSILRQDGNLLAAQKIRPLLEMADRLRSQADLTVSTVDLCSRVEAFGKYTPISPARFPAGRDNPAIVYCEVDNFLANQNAQGMWQTKLSEQVTLFTDLGMMVWSDAERPVSDECRRRRHDFFAYNVIHLPANLTIGRYMLKVSIEDKNAGRVAESTVPLQIVAQ